MAHGGFRAWVVERHAAFVTRHPGAVLSIALALAIAAWPLASTLPLKAGRLDLAPVNDPSVVAYRAFNRAFGTLHTVFMILGGPPAEVRAFADRAAHDLEAHSDHIRSVIHKLDVDQLEAQSLQAATPAQLEDIAHGIARLQPVWKHLARTPNVQTLVERVVDEITDEEAPAPSVAEALQATDVLGAALRAADHVLARSDASNAPSRAIPAASPGDPGREIDALDPGVAERAKRGLDASGYLVSRSGEHVLLVISPAYAVDEPALVSRMMHAVDEALVPVRAAYPRVTVGFAGAPIQDVEEQATVASDMAFTALLAYLAVLLLSFLAFRNVWVAVRSNLVLALAVYLTLALANLLVGQVNIISSVFIAVLVGLGDDFGIYLFTMYRDAYPRYGKDAMAHVLRQGVPGLSTGACTVAAAFLALQLQDFRAFRELGLIAGVGVVVAFLCMVTVLPAVIVLMESRFPMGIPAGPDAAHHPAVAGAGAGGWIISHIIHWRLPIVIAGVVLMALAAAAAPRVGFEYDLTQLQSASAAAVLAEARLRDEFGLGSEFVVVRNRAPAEAAAAAARLRALPAVGYVSGFSDVVPSPGPGHPAAIARIAVLARDLAPVVDERAPVPAPDPAACRQALEKMTQAIDLLAKLAKMEDSKPLVAALARLDAERLHLLATLNALPPLVAADRLATITPVLSTRLRRVRASLLRAVDAVPYTLATLPPALRQRYVGRDDSVATYAWPARPLTSPEEMSAFVNGVTAVPGEVAGLPIMVFRMLELIRKGLLRTALPALAAILLMVLLDFRDPRMATFGLIPMAGGTLATVGLMGWAGASWNPVNSIALSVMLGVGVDYGVNIVHRWQDEGDIRVVLAGAGRAILYAGATSVIGFGTLTLAQHRGLQSFGRTMALGNFCEMLVALIFLPALLSWRVSASAPKE